jgi:hypothetical protein
VKLEVLHIQTQLDKDFGLEFKVTGLPNPRKNSALSIGKQNLPKNKKYNKIIMQSSKIPVKFFKE